MRQVSNERSTTPHVEGQDENEIIIKGGGILVNREKKRGGLERETL